MKLLPKSELVKAKSVDREREIQEGLKLAKRVDTLREVAAQEDASLSKFRSESLTQIAKDIAAGVKERDELESGNKMLREERIRLEAPIDLTREWEQVRQDKKSFQEWNDDLLSRKIGLTKRENDVSEALSGFSKREEKLRKEEEWVQETSHEISQLHQEAVNDRQEAQNTLLRADSDLRARYAALHSREADLDTNLTNLVVRGEQVRKDQETIINDKKRLADRQAMLERGFAELRKKQHG